MHGGSRCVVTLRYTHVCYTISASCIRSNQGLLTDRRLLVYGIAGPIMQEEFLDFFNLRLKAKFADFIEKKGWRQLSPRHEEDDDDTDYDGACDEGSGGGVRGMGGVAGGVPGMGSFGGVGRGALVGSDTDEHPAINVDGRMVSRPFSLPSHRTNHL